MEDKSKLWYFENFNLFDSLSMKELLELDKKADMMEKGKGQVVDFGSSGHIYFLKSGKVKISKTMGGGREIALNILGPGDIFGEMPLAGEKHGRGEYAEALEDTVICCVNHSEFKKYIEEKPQLNRKILKIIGLKLKKIQSKYESLVFKTAEERVRAFIKELAEEHGKKLAIGGIISIRLRLAHKDVAKLTATSRQKVSSVFNKLERAGIISYDRKKILVKEIHKL